ncbi:MAG: hypothetical protein SF339_08425 [Blastocatellia bacterium]|nr:hypothetical protein [Blastocatellia bacterium]
MPSDSKRERTAGESRSGSKAPRDDFKAIEGLGEAFEQWLQENFQVRTYADLGALSAQKIRSRAKQAGIAPSLAEIERILAQARLLAEAAPSAEAASPPAEEGEEKDWKEFASFMVYFERKLDGEREEKRTTVERRTGVHHMETGEQESWPGIEAGQACEWMLERLGEKAEREAALSETTVAPPGLEVSEPVELKIQGVQLRQPPDGGMPHDLLLGEQAYSGLVRAGVPLSLTVTLRFVGPGAPSLAEMRREFNVFVDAEEMTTASRVRIGASPFYRLKQGQLSYAITLSPTTFSSGLYRLRIGGIVREPQPFWSYVEVPMLQVS